MSTKIYKHYETELIKIRDFAGVKALFREFKKNDFEKLPKYFQWAKKLTFKKKYFFNFFGALILIEYFDDDSLRPQLKKMYLRMMRVMPVSLAENLAEVLGMLLKKKDYNALDWYFELAETEDEKIFNILILSLKEPFSDKYALKGDAVYFNRLLDFLRLMFNTDHEKVAGSLFNYIIAKKLIKNNFDIAVKKYKTWLEEKELSESIKIRLLYALKNEELKEDIEKILEIIKPFAKNKNITPTMLKTVQDIVVFFARLKPEIVIPELKKWQMRY